MATSIIAMVEVVGMFGFDTALIQNPNASRTHYDTAWTLNVIVNSILAVALLILAVPASLVYGEHRVQAMVMWLAVGTFIKGFENIGVVVFQRELRFAQEFKFLAAKRMVSVLVTIPLAVVFRSHWALVAGIVAGRALAVIMSYLIQNYRPRLSLAARRELMHFSKWMMFMAILNFVTTRASDFVVGRFAGAQALGLLNVASETANLPTSDLVAPINRAIFPGYARVAGDAGALKEKYLGVISLIAALAMPAGAGIAATAGLLVPLALGPKWIEATPMLVALSFYSILVVLTTNNHYVYLAIGRPSISTFVGIIHSCILLPSVIIGSAGWGAYGAALAFLGGQVLFTPISMATIARNLKLHLADQLRAFFRPLLAVTAMYGVVSFVEVQVAPSSASARQLIGPFFVCVATGFIVYVAVLYTLWMIAGRPEGPETQIRKWVSDKLGVAV
jgi:O-antigen/teichoic acid export membrane protein